PAARDRADCLPEPVRVLGDERRELRRQEFLACTDTAGALRKTDTYLPVRQAADRCRRADRRRVAAPVATRRRLRDLPSLSRGCHCHPAETVGVQDPGHGAPSSVWLLLRPY